MSEEEMSQSDIEEMYDKFLQVEMKKVNGELDFVKSSLSQHFPQLYTKGKLSANKVLAVLWNILQISESRVQDLEEKLDNVCEEIGLESTENDDELSEKNEEDNEVDIEN